MGRWLSAAHVPPDRVDAMTKSLCSQIVKSRGHAVRKTNAQIGSSVKRHVCHCREPRTTAEYFIWSYQMSEINRAVDSARWLLLNVLKKSA